MKTDSTASKLAVALWLISVASPLIGLETESDSFAIDITEAQGRFSIYRIEGADRTPLYVADDPTSTYLSVLLNNRIYRLGDSFDFRQAAEATDLGAKLVFASSRLEIEIDVDLSGQSDVIIDATISNVAETDLEVGLRVLLDTYLGEDGVHFTTPDGEVEAEIDFEAPPDYIFSGDDSGDGVFLDFASNRATAPDRIILANWKRLDDTSWSYTINNNRNFSVSPYSINDSAVSLYFNPQTLERDATRRIRLVLATEVFGTTTPVATTSSATRVTSESTTQPQEIVVTIEDTANVTEVITSIDSLIGRIEQLLSSTEEPTADQVEQLRAEIDALRASLLE